MPCITNDPWQVPKSPLAGYDPRGGVLPSHPGPSTPARGTTSGHSTWGIAWGAVIPKKVHEFNRAWSLPLLTEDQSSVIIA